MLTTLIGQADNEEVKELRRIRDRSKVLEGENAALQKRLKDQDSKIINSEKAALTARQSLAQAQQRAAEWERRAKEYEGQLEQTQTKLDQAEQTQAQLDADYSLVNLQLEEREADDRLAKVSSYDNTLLLQGSLFTCRIGKTRSVTKLPPSKPKSHVCKLNSIRQRRSKLQPPLSPLRIGRSRMATYMPLAQTHVPAQYTAIVVP
jgi:hypothetical protein